MTLESKIKSKKHSIHRLRRERDGCIAKLEVEHGQHQASLERLALAEEESSSAQVDAELMKAEVELTREALSWAIEDFKNSKEFKEEILEDGFTSYCVGYEDGRDAIKKLYPDLNLSSSSLQYRKMKLLKKPHRPKLKHRPCQKLSKPPMLHLGKEIRTMKNHDQSNLFVLLFVIKHL